MAKKKKQRKRRLTGWQGWFKGWRRTFRKAFKKIKPKKTRYISKKRRAQRRNEIWLGTIAILGLMLFFLLQDQQGVPSSSETSSSEIDIVYTDQEFVDLIGQYAVTEYPNSHVLPSIVTAQAILESNFGKSQLSSNYFNLFGHKSYNPNDPSVDLPTKEFVNGQYITVDEPFRVYQSWEESVADHGRLLANGTSWNDTHYDSVLNASSYQEAAYALQEAGYATDPNYAESLIDVIERYELTRFDDQVQ
ncbi:N-acetylmuramoyl-L-alanine amidase [Aerococcus viridans]|uniref:N-acetylmuramoyl-L-alanine amidase n=1 Tax=Aerococcus viridans TaxID=1377 RepID=A0A2N6UEJ0_9LACT|nr:glycoside hydrolase family 73 protein [Aerococcus viridans]PMC79965.1 N-acetylmuramoyl-L-alanine amidase [Aerococcus viridans]